MPSSHGLYSIYASELEISDFLLNGSCFNNTNKNVLLSAVTEAVLLSIALVLDSILNKDWVIVEPSTSNPFKLVAGVLKYAWTHKKSEFRSAFMSPTKITGGHQNLLFQSNIWWSVQYRAG